MLILLQCLWSVISTHHPDIDLLCQALQALAISRTPFLLGAQGEVIWLPENNMHSSCSHPFRLCHQTIWFLKDKEVSLFFFFPPLTFCLFHVAEGQDEVGWKDLQEFGTQKNPSALPEGIRFSWRLSFWTGPVLPAQGKWIPGWSIRKEAHKLLQTDFPSPSQRFPL